MGENEGKKGRSSKGKKKKVGTKVGSHREGTVLREKKEGESGATEKTGGRRVAGASGRYGQTG